MKKPSVFPLIPRADILRRIRVLSELITRVYGEGQLPLFVPIMEGAGPFAAELLSYFPHAESLPLRMHSYCGTAPGPLVLEQPTEGQRSRFYQRDVLFLDDIIDSGKTLAAAVDQAKRWGASDVQAATLLARSSAMAGTPWLLHTTCVITTDKFVVGFGMDYEGKHRGLSEIHTIEEEPSEVQP